MSTSPTVAPAPDVPVKDACNRRRSACLSMPASQTAECASVMTCRSGRTGTGRKTPSDQTPFASAKTTLSPNVPTAAGSTSYVTGTEPPAGTLTWRETVFNGSVPS